MRRQVASALEEVRLQLELDEERGSAPLSVPARALRGARAACDRPAERQALIDLAAACVACAPQLPAPRIAFAGRCGAERLLSQGSGEDWYRNGLTRLRLRRARRRGTGRS